MITKGLGDICLWQPALRSVRAVSHLISLYIARYASSHLPGRELVVMFATGRRQAYLRDGWWSGSHACTRHVMVPLLGVWISRVRRGSKALSSNHGLSELPQCLQRRSLDFTLTLRPSRVFTTAQDRLRVRLSRSWRGSRPRKS